MKTERQVGFSIVSKAPLGCALSSVLLVVSAIISLHLELIPLGLASGVVCGLLLLAYWLGKGGSFFILALICPSVAFFYAELNSINEMLQLVISFYWALSVILTIYKLKKRL